MPRIPYRPHGIVRDIPPSEVAPEFWTGGERVQVRNGQTIANPGSAERIIDPGDRVHWMINSRGSSSWWVYHEDGGIYQTDGNSGPTNIATTSTPANFTLTGAPWKASECSGGLLHNIPYMLCGDNPPVYWPQTGNCLETSNWDDYGAATGSAGCLFTFKNHVFTGDVQGDDARVAWTDAIEAGTPLADWEVGTDNEAGFVDLSDTRGAIQNGLSLGRSCAIYKDSGGAYLCDYIGGNQVFAFRLFSRELGMLARHGVADVDRGHIVLSDDDIVLHDGKSIQSVIQGSNRRWLFNNIDADNVTESWAVYNRPENEVWICVPLTGSLVPNLAAILDLGTGRWGFRDLGRGSAGQGLTYGARGIVQDSGASFEWDSYGGTWAEATDTWDATLFQANQDVLLTAELTDSSTDDGVFTVQDVGTTDSAGNTILGEVERFGLDLGAPDEIKMIRAIHLNAKGAGSIIVRAGGRMVENEATRWDAPRTVDLTSRQQYDCRVSGRLIDVKMSVPQDVELAGFTVEIASSSPQ